MNKQIIRYFLWTIILFLIFIIFNTWENEKNLSEKLKIKNDELKIKKVIEEKNLEDSSKEIIIDTNLINSKINLTTGNITFLSLKNYPISIEEKNKNIIIIDKTEKNFSTIDSRFLISNLENKTSDIYSSTLTNYFINENESNLLVNLEYKISDEIIINKIYTFKSYAYDINVDFYIRNNQQNIIKINFYGTLKQKKSDAKSSFLDAGINGSESGAVYNNSKPFNKISFDDSSFKNISYSVDGGWIAFLKHYFIFSWIPDPVLKYTYTIEKNDDFYTLKYITENEIIINPGECECFESKLYIGPKIKNKLDKLYKGLDLTIDYGVLWPIASPIFMLLNKIYKFINNWGFSIILVTLLIKLLFFHLSSLSYESMGRMKNLQPRLDLLKERFKDDKKQFGQAVLDLYKKEKVNPLSGCFPVLIQIPVFISLYYVLIESIELRHAPFILWIQDLSSKDPYYILPIIMSITIFIQQKINPPIQDPVQAKIMMFIPFIFLIIFLQFPSGLIIYWIINNILSILQQIIIMKKIKN